MRSVCFFGQLVSAMGRMPSLTELLNYGRHELVSGCPRISISCRQHGTPATPVLPTNANSPPTRRSPSKWSRKDRRRTHGNTSATMHHGPPHPGLHPAPCPGGRSVATSLNAVISTLHSTIHARLQWSPQA